jgi:hypothetical protein
VDLVSHLSYVVWLGSPSTVSCGSSGTNYNDSETPPGVRLVPLELREFLRRWSDTKPPVLDVLERAAHWYVASVSDSSAPDAYLAAWVGLDVRMDAAGSVVTGPRREYQLFERSGRKFWLTDRNSERPVALPLADWRHTQLSKSWQREIDRGRTRMRLRSHHDDHVVTDAGAGTAGQAEHIIASNFST